MGKKHDRSDENCGLGREIEIVEGWSCDETMRCDVDKFERLIKLLKSGIIKAECKNGNKIYRRLKENDVFILFQDLIQNKYAR